MDLLTIEEEQLDAVTANLRFRYRPIGRALGSGD